MIHADKWLLGYAIRTNAYGPLHALALEERVGRVNKAQN